MESKCHKFGKYNIINGSSLESNRAKSTGLDILFVQYPLYSAPWEANPYWLDHITQDLLPSRLWMRLANHWGRMKRKEKLGFCFPSSFPAEFQIDWPCSLPWATVTHNSSPSVFTLTRSQEQLLHSPWVRKMEQVPCPIAPFFLLLLVPPAVSLTL